MATLQKKLNNLREELMQAFKQLIAGLALLVAGAAIAQEQAPEMTPEEQQMWAAFEASMVPGEPHAFLAKQEGEFVATVKSFEDPSGEPEISESMVVRSMELGGRVLREEWTGTVMGMPFKGVGRTGYDNVTGRFWSTWTDNLSTGLFVAYGKRLEDGSLEFKGEMPDPISGGMVPTRSVAKHGDAVEVMDMYRMMGDEEVRIMNFELRRR